ncbi:MAG TPA: hypothetical protein VFQ39_04500 [Longimicrobium sp.]|nr:hypothetical protein [Longimicrobium sp.]
MNFPLELRFKILAIAQQISVTDATGRLVMYVKQKAFKLKEAVTVFADQEQTKPLYTIGADRVLDISATYFIRDAATNEVLGSVKRHGMKSFWRAHYEISRGGGPILVIREENPWVKVADAVLGEIPILGVFTGYFFHPAYRVSPGENAPPVMRIVKHRAFLEGRFEVQKLAELNEGDERVAVLSILMMTLLERARG